MRLAMPLTPSASPSVVSVFANGPQVQYNIGAAFPTTPGAVHGYV